MNGIAKQRWIEAARTATMTTTGTSKYMNVKTGFVLWDNTCKIVTHL